MKTLADESTRSSHSIIEGVTAVQHATESTIGVLESVTSRITEISHQVEQIAAASHGTAGRAGLVPVADRLRHQVASFVEAIRATERRGARRAEVAHPAQLRTTESVVEVVLRNISLTGAAFEAPAQAGLSPGDRVRLTVPTPSGSLDCTCTVLRVARRANGRLEVASRIVYKRPPYEAALAALTGDT